MHKRVPQGSVLKYLAFPVDYIVMVTKMPIDSLIRFDVRYTRITIHCMSMQLEFSSMEKNSLPAFLKTEIASFSLNNPSEERKEQNDEVKNENRSFPCTLFRCGECSYACNRKGDLNRHASIHSR
ncbi:hypothetical protein Avbf_17918 [Armadillidium vulgare]|nr:hypothetical protein Avbf_17918 [Armadillidium vulgare]